jgi:hypothetical protein
MNARKIVLAFGVTLIAPFTASRPSLAEDANPFDGSLNAEVVCPASPDRGAGYAWRLPVRITEGTLSGTYHSPTTQAEGDLSGWVRPDGKAIVAVTGLAGRDQSIGHVLPGTRFRYTADVQFAGDKGAGQRQQLRPCTLRFSRA